MPLQMLIVSDSELTRPPWTRCCPTERGAVVVVEAVKVHQRRGALTWPRLGHLGLVTRIRIISDHVIHNINIS